PLELRCAGNQFSLSVGHPRTPAKTKDQIMKAHGGKGSSLRGLAMLAMATAGLTIVACLDEKSESASSTVSQSVDHQHHLVVEWVTVGSLAELTTKSDLIVRGKVTEVRYDAIRNYPWNAQAESEMTTDEAGGVYHDTPVTGF